MNEDPNYYKLVAYGHSGFKAIQILIDAKRGDRFAKLWIEAATGTLYQTHTVTHGLAGSRVGQ